MSRLNPKDAAARLRPPLSCMPLPPLFEAAAGLFEGARKYGRHNYRAAPVLASVYFDATMRHLAAWWEGEDVDPDSGLSHIAKALASLLVLRDAQLQGKHIDDRPPPARRGWLKRVRKQIEAIAARVPEVEQTGARLFNARRAPGTRRKRCR